MLEDGDIVNVDVTPIVDGFHGDSSRTFLIGEVSPKARQLVADTYRALWLGIRAVRPGARAGDIGHAIQSFVEAAGLLGGARVHRPRHRAPLPHRAGDPALRHARAPARRCCPA